MTHQPASGSGPGHAPAPGDNSGWGSGRGALAGYVAASLLVPALLYAGPAGWAVLGVMVGVAFGLATRADQFRRGLGSGVLAAVSLVTLAVGACFAIFAGF